MERPRLTHRLPFWGVLAALAVLAVVFAIRTFPTTFPIVTIDLQMDRAGALASARALAEEAGWGPDGFRQATTFGDPEPQVRTFLELELGEEDTLGRLVRDGGYHPFHWRVRHFREGDPTEVLIRFTPGGHPWGFRVQLPEDQPGAALEVDAARELAEATARGWGVELRRYHFMETAQVVRPGGRVDHTFTYRLGDADLGEGQYRLRLRVSGDLPSEVTHFVHIPEAFSRRYEEVRAGNTRLAFVASVLFLAFFVGGGCVVGSILLLRAGWLTWRTASVLGVGVAALMASDIPNALPTSWMGYDTAVSARFFLAEQWMLAVGIFLAGAVALAVVLMAAESMGRRAFPQHPRLWEVWRPGVANTRGILGRILAGYAIIAFELAFVVAFYAFVGSREGWWAPSDTLIQPDLVANHLPWLTAASISLFAGLWEESVFRAVPIAGAALLGARYGRPGLWIVGALILQAVVFAAAHADYPQQPPYARVVELTLPAFIWGIVYLKLGLLPVILAHAGYNLSLISIPIFASSAPGIWGDRTILIAVALLPLAVVLYRIRRGGLQHTIPEEGMNRSWRPEAKEIGPAPPPPERVAAPVVPSGSAVGTARGLALAGVGGILLWWFASPSTAHTPRLEVDRSAAEARAATLLREREIVLPAEWRTFSWVDAGLTAGHRFVWEKGGEEVFGTLLNTYLQPPHWHVRFAGFDGPVEERAEEVEWNLGPTPERVDRFRHRLPEAREGASLAEEEARILALDEVERALGLLPHHLTEVSASDRSLPDRRNWTFTFSHRDGFPLQEGEARIRITVAGDRIGERTPFVYVPEEWRREDTARSRRNAALSMVTVGVTALLFLLLAIGGAVRWARGGFARRPALWVALGSASVMGLLSWNGWPASVATFQTAQPFGDQAMILGVGALVGALFLGGALGMAAGYVHGREEGERRGHAVVALLGGAGLGFVGGGVAALVTRILPAYRPVWPSMGAADATFPALSVALDPVVGLLAGGILLLAILEAALRMEAKGRSPALVAGLLLLVGLVLPRSAQGPELWGWILSGLGLGVGLVILHAAVKRLGRALIPAVMTALLIPDQVGEARFDAFPGAVPGSLLAVALLAGVAWIWTRALVAPTLSSAESAAPPGP